MDALFYLPTVPESDPSLTSARVLPPAAARPASPLGVASSAVAVAAAGAGATDTPPTGATAAAHLGTPSLVPAAVAGVEVHRTNATGPGTSVLCGDSRPEPPLLLPMENGECEGAMGCVRLCAPL